MTTKELKAGTEIFVDYGNGMSESRDLGVYGKDKEKRLTLGRTKRWLFDKIGSSDKAKDRSQGWRREKPNREVGRASTEA